MKGKNMPNMQPTEREMILKIQAQLATAKDSIRAVIQTCGKLAPVVETAAGKKSANAVMRLRGQAEIALGTLDSGHADASDALIEGFADGGDVVAHFGGR
jgi:hypothetical protein